MGARHPALQSAAAGGPSAAHKGFVEWTIAVCDRLAFDRGMLYFVDLFYMDLNLHLNKN